MKGDFSLPVAFFFYQNGCTMEDNGAIYLLATSSNLLNRHFNNNGCVLAWKLVALTQISSTEGVPNENNL